MKISYQWLCEIVPGLESVPAAVLAHKLTMAGLEVEELLDESAQWRGLVVGEVLEKQKHPQADKLNICSVNDGHGVHQVVCGAANVETGKKYPFATLGTVMPSGLKIQPVKLRGIESFGMLCSASELGLSEKSTGLLELPPSAPVGQSLAEHFGRTDVLLTINVTPNRGDALSHWGVARDVSALVQRQADFDVWLPKSVDLPMRDVAARACDLKIEVGDAQACARYTGSQIFGVRVSESPNWLKKRLEALGVRSINNVVDATNYVMMLTGHPVHAFDARFVAGHSIRVDTLAAPKKFKTLDAVERDLQAGDVVISDAGGPIALAGIMGGLQSSVLPETTDLILEVAFFAPDPIRKTSRRLDLQTESAYRFARFVNPQTVIAAHRILQKLILALAGGVPSQIQDVCLKPFVEKTIPLKASDWQNVLGVSLAGETACQILRSLGLGVEGDGAGWLVRIPVGRSDLERPIDLVEEIGRIYGLDKIEAEMPRLRLRSPKQSPIYAIDQSLKSFWQGQGFSETVHLSFVDHKALDAVEAVGKEGRVSLSNPISEDLSVLRSTHLPQLLECFKTNRRNSEAGLKFFEMRKVYQKTASGSVEQNRLTALYGGNPYGRNRFGLQAVPDFYYGKGLLEKCFAQKNANFVTKLHTAMPYHPGQSLAYFVEDQLCASIGAVHPEILQRYKIKDKLFAVEINLEVWAKLPDATARYQPISSLPHVYRDLALLLDKTQSYETVLKTILSEKPAELIHVHLFDVYEGEHVSPNKVSLAFSMVYEAKSESLTDEQVNVLHFALVDRLKSKLNAELR